MTDNINLKDLSLSLNHDLLAQKLTNDSNILVIQDLDGVCMKLVKNPLDRIIDWEYVMATKKLAGHFFVLTNGEYIGNIGVNKIIEKASPNSQQVKEKGYYLPGLAGGGVQWQDCFANVSHPGVTEKELNFLASVPKIVRERLLSFCDQFCPFFTSEESNNIINGVILDNFASPTVNLNAFYEKLLPHNSLYIQLQKEVEILMNDLLNLASQQGLNDSFFVHYAPNLGRDDNGLEILRRATDNDSGTTDFQFMLTGAIKEAGVLFILNYYYYLTTGEYPLGKDFNVRKAPRTQEKLLDLVINHFAPEKMPLIIGVGDTVNSQVEEQNGSKIVRRGGSDRNFLQLIQNISNIFNIDSAVVYIDSSQGEIKNRKALKLDKIGDKSIVIEGPGDSQDLDDPLTLNIVFPQGYQQYCRFFIDVANQRN